VVISRRILLGVRNILGKSCRENQNTHFTLKKDFSETYAIYEIMWKRFCTALQATDENEIRRMRLACWVPKAAHTHTHTRAHTHTHTICNIYCFSTRIIVTRKILNITFYIIRLCFIECHVVLLLRLRYTYRD